MSKVFLDANVYFSASRSPTGGSSAILKLGEKKKFSIYATSQVLREAERNIRKKEPLSARLRFYDLLSDTRPKMVKIDKKKVEKEYQKMMNRKDSFVLAGAKKAKVNYLVTLDRKHFFTKKVKQARLPFQILTPGELLRELSKT